MTFLILTALVALAVYFIVRGLRERRLQLAEAAPRLRIVPPDDDPEFLRHLDQLIFEQRRRRMRAQHDEPEAA